jgi:hypothetical protein
MWRKDDYFPRGSNHTKFVTTTMLLIVVASIEGFGIYNSLWYIGLQMPYAGDPPGIHRGMGA